MTKSMLALGFKKYESDCYESPKRELTSYVFEHLIYNLKSYNGIEI